MSTISTARAEAVRHERQREGVGGHRPDDHQAGQQPDLHHAALSVRDAGRRLRHLELHGQRHDHRARACSATPRCRRPIRPPSAAERRPPRGSTSGCPRSASAAACQGRCRHDPRPAHRAALGPLFGLIVGGATSARAQSLRPNIMFLFDTSGSMHEDSNLVDRADGTTVCPQSTTSRIYSLKSGIREALQQVGTDEANFGLMSFPQTVQNAYTTLTATQCTNTGQTPIGHYPATRTQTITVPNRAPPGTTTRPLPARLPDDDQQLGQPDDLRDLVHDWRVAGVRSRRDLGRARHDADRGPVRPAGRHPDRVHLPVDRQRRGADQHRRRHRSRAAPQGQHAARPLAVLRAASTSQNEVIPNDPRGAAGTTSSSSSPTATTPATRRPRRTTPSTTQTARAAGTSTTSTRVNQACLLNKAGVKVYVITDTDGRQRRTTPSRRRAARAPRSACR